MIDEYGLYVQENFDRGDCANRSGIMLSYFSLTGQASKARGLFIKIVTNLKGLDNKWIRGLPPKEENKHLYNEYTFWSDPKDFSRDQMSRLMSGFTACSFYSYVQDEYIKIFNNNFRHQNGDFIGFGEIGIYNRCKDKKPWFLWILDIRFIIDLITRRFSLWDSDSLILPDLYLALKRYPTWTSRLASKLYVKTDALKHIKNNHSLERNGCIEVSFALEELFNNIKNEKSF